MTIDTKPHPACELQNWINHLVQSSPLHVIESLTVLEHYCAVLRHAVVNEYGENEKLVTMTQSTLNEYYGDETPAPRPKKRRGRKNDSLVKMIRGEEP
jgi:hypothetical protein